MSNDGTTHNIGFLNNCVTQFDQFLPPLCLIVDSTDHRPQQLTAFGPLPVTNTVLRTGDGHKVEACGWRQQANVLAGLTTGNAYWFFNCRAKARYQQTDCWYRISVDGFSAMLLRRNPGMMNTLSHRREMSLAEMAQNEIKQHNHWVGLVLKHNWTHDQAPLHVTDPLSVEQQNRYTHLDWSGPLLCDYGPRNRITPLQHRPPNTARMSRPSSFPPPPPAPRSLCSPPTRSIIIIIPAS
uniref:DUF4912 domain-containing protein n=1 Tax=Globodera pallida TaxID=36090 RepID=A0A183BHL7_GLOPA